MEKRFEEMGKLAQLLKVAIPAEKGTFLHDRINQDLQPTPAEKKTEVKCSIRAYFILKAYQYITNSTFDQAFTQLEDCQNGYPISKPHPKPDLLEIIKIGEYCITIMYLENHLCDLKYGIKTEKSKKKNRMELRDVSWKLFHCVNNNFSLEHNRSSRSIIKRLFRLYYFGMFLEDQELSYSNFQKNDPLPISTNLKVREDPILDKIDCFTALINKSIEQGRYNPIKNQNFLKRYITRSFLINGIFFQLFTELLINFYGENNQFKELIRFAQIFGLLQQLVNDTFDYLPYAYSFPTASKYQSDTFADARNQLMTLPTICYFNKPEDDKIPDPEVEKLFGFPPPTFETLSTNKYQIGITQKLLANRAISQCRSLTSYLAKEGSEILNGNSLTVDILNDVLSIGRRNKFFKSYEFIYKERLRKNRK